MKIELLVAFVVLATAIVGGLGTWYFLRTPSQRAIGDKHRHRWSKWKVVAEKEIHTYGQVDEGRDLPDRLDAFMRRECVRCGMPQTTTARGLKSTYKE